VDVVHFLAALPLGRLGAGVRRETSKPYTVVAHGSGEILVPARLPFARRALRDVLQKADLVFPVSSFTQEAVRRVTGGTARTHVLHPSVDIDRFSLEVSGAPMRTRHALGGRFVVLFVSRLVKRKGGDILVRALAAFRDCVAVIVGDGPERKSLERLAHEMEVADRVIFTGAVGDDELPSYYAGADVFCMPCTSRYGGLDTEGFGIVYLEAQASGLPCIAGRCGGSAEAVEDRVSGFVLDESDPRSVALAIRRLRKDDVLRARLGGAGRERAEYLFSPQAAAEEMTEAVEQVLAGRS
jgi:phosphatidylinositol alpha-1,6-mannosyltransferase